MFSWSEAKNRVDVAKHDVSPDESGHEEIHILSVRRATKFERKIHEQGL